MGWITDSLTSPIRDALLLERERVDAWANALSGLGSRALDKSMHTKFQRVPVLTADECADLYHGDPIARIVADAYPEEALRRKVKFVGPDATRIEDELKAVKFTDKIQQGAAFGRAMGGAIAVLGIEDKGKRTEKFNPKRGQGLSWVDVYDRRQLRPVAYETDPMSPYASQCSVFGVQPEDGKPSFEVHRSRCIVFGGVTTAQRERTRNQGWDHSVYDLIYQALRQFNEGQLSIGHMLSEASQSVFKLRGLLSQITDPGGKERLAKRGLLLDMFRGITRSILLDADSGESYERHAMNFSGVPDIIDRQVNLVSAVSRIPVTKLIGSSPAGLNATGEGDARSWYDNASTYREREIEPCYTFAIAAMNGNCVVEFQPMWTPTDKERAEVEKLETDADCALIDRQVCSPEDVARARLGKERKRVTVDVDLLGPVVEVPAAVTEPTSNPSAEITLTPSDQILIVTVNQGLESLGLPMLASPDGDLTIAQFKEKNASLLAAVATAEAGGPKAEPTPDLSGPADFRTAPVPEPAPTPPALP